jgi:hypothetical protein
MERSLQGRKWTDSILAGVRTADDQVLLVIEAHWIGNGRGKPGGIAYAVRGGGGDGGHGTLAIGTVPVNWPFLFVVTVVEPRQVSHWPVGSAAKNSMRKALLGALLSEKLMVMVAPLLIALVKTRAFVDWLHCLAAAVQAHRTNRPTPSLLSSQ